MDRENYQKRIDDLLNAVSSLLDVNNAMGERIQKLEKIAEDYEDLKAENANEGRARYAQTCPAWQVLLLSLLQRRNAIIIYSLTTARPMVACKARTAVNGQSGHLQIYGRVSADSVVS